MKMNPIIKIFFGGFIFLLVYSAPVYGSETILRLMVGVGHAPKQRVEEFEKQIAIKYGRQVKLQITHSLGPEDFFDSVRGKNVDLVMMTHHYFKDERFNYIKNGLLLPLDLKNIPNFKFVIPALQKAEYSSNAGKVYASPVSQGPYGLAYNTTLLRGQPSSWNILWNPNYQGKYIIGANEYMYNAVITALALGYSRESITDFDIFNNVEFKQKLRQLAVNAHSFWVGVDTADALLGKSLATSWGDSMRPLKERGELWKIAEPVEGSPSWIDNYAITWALEDKPFLKKVAEEYINKLLTTDYQINHIMHHLSLSPIITNIGNLLTKTEKERIHIGTPDFFNTNRILLPTFSRRTRNGFKLLWEDIIKEIPIENKNR